MSLQYRTLICVNYLVYETLINTDIAIPIYICIHIINLMFISVVISLWILCSTYRSDLSINCEVCISFEFVINVMWFGYGWLSGIINISPCFSLLLDMVPSDFRHIFCQKGFGLLITRSPDGLDFYFKFPFSSQWRYILDMHVDASYDTEGLRLHILVRHHTN